MKTLLLAATSAAVLAFGVAAPASAASVVNPNGTVTLDATDPFTWVVVANATMGDGFDGDEQSTITYNFTGVAGNSYNFTYSLDNTTVGGTNFPGGPSIAVFGFNVTGAPLSVLAGGTDEFQEGSGGNFNGLSPNVTYCFFAGSNCNGGGNAGVFAPETPALGSFTINYGSLQSSITMSNFASRFQRTGDDFEGSASGFGSIVPEPATWAMMIGGFGLVGAAMRRKKASAVLA